MIALYNSHSTTERKRAYHQHNIHVLLKHGGRVDGKRGAGLIAWQRLKGVIIKKVHNDAEFVSEVMDLWCQRKDAVIAVCYPVCYIVEFRDSKRFLPTRQIPYYALPLESRMVSQNENKYRLEDKPELDSNHHL